LPAFLVKMKSSGRLRLVPWPVRKSDADGKPPAFQVQARDPEEQVETNAISCTYPAVLMTRSERKSQTTQLLPFQRKAFQINAAQHGCFPEVGICFPMHWVSLYFYMFEYIEWAGSVKPKHGPRPCKGRTASAAGTVTNSGCFPI